MNYTLQILIGCDTGKIFIEHLNGELELIYQGSKHQAKSYYYELTKNL